MKRVKIGIITILLIFVATLNTYASQSYRVQVRGASTVEQGEEFILTVQLSDLIDIGGVAEGITAFTADVVYDSNRLERVAGQGQNGFNTTWGNRLVVDSAEGASENTDVATLRFRARDNAELGATTIAVNNVLGSNGSENISASNTSMTVEIVATTGGGGTPGGDTGTPGAGNDNNASQDRPNELPFVGTYTGLIVPISLSAIMAIVAAVKYKRFLF